MEKLQLKTIFADTFRVIGVTLPFKTINLNNQSSNDCGSLWEKFYSNNYSSMIPNKKSDDVIAVYFDYEGDYKDPFSYIIGHRVTENTSPPAGMHYVDINAGKYLKVTAYGNVQKCMQEAWIDIWNSDLKRTYKYDFEIYKSESLQSDYAEVDIFVGIE